MTTPAFLRAGFFFVAAICVSSCAAETDEDEEQDDIDFSADALTGKSGKSCHDSYNHTCAVALAVPALAARSIHPFRIDVAGRMQADACTVVVGGKTIRADAEGSRAMRDDAVTLNRGVWRDIEGQRYYYAWSARLAWADAPGCGSHRKPYLKSGWLRADALAHVADAHAAVTMNGKHAQPIGMYARKGKDGPAYTVRAHPVRAREESCGMKPGVTSAALCWHYLDLDAHVGRGIHEVYVAASIGDAGIDVVPDGATFVVEEDGGGLILEDKRVYSMAGSAKKIIGSMRYAYGHVKGSHVRGWIAAANLYAGAQGVCGFKDEKGKCGDL